MIVSDHGVLLTIGSRYGPRYFGTWQVGEGQAKKWKPDFPEGAYTTDLCGRATEFLARP